jgi:formate hydrogenlyase subunit 4
MSLILSLVAQLLHVALMIAAAPLAAGAADWLEARFAGRSGPPVLHPWRDLVRQSRKTPAETEAGSVVLRHAPAVAFGVTLAAAALVPSFTLSMALAPLADCLVVVSLLAVARVAEVLGALDGGAASPGLAAQNSSAAAVPAEAALIVIVVAMALMGGSFDLDTIINQVRDTGWYPGAAAAIVLAGLLVLAVIDHDAAGSGLDQVASDARLALMRQTAWIRRLVWFDLIGALFLPIGLATAGSGPIDWCAGLLAWAVRLGGFILGLAAIRALLGPVSSRRAPRAAAVGLVLGMIAIVLVLASARQA